MFGLFKSPNNWEGKTIEDFFFYLKQQSEFDRFIYRDRSLDKILYPWLESMGVIGNLNSKTMILPILYKLAKEIDLKTLGLIAPFNINKKGSSLLTKERLLMASDKKIYLFSSSVRDITKGMGTLLQEIDYTSIVLGRSSPKELILILDTGDMAYFSKGMPFPKMKKGFDPIKTLETLLDESQVKIRPQASCVGLINNAQGTLLLFKDILFLVVGEKLSGIPLSEISQIESRIIHQKRGKQLTVFNPNMGLASTLDTGGGQTDEYKTLSLIHTKKGEVFKISEPSNLEESETIFKVIDHYLFNHFKPSL